ncbi:MAG: SUMF1/EgtB/PvdO family nonheme iron enzyme [Alphaproteobacteria bacterium]|nr:SUMF1/EgtB/PvdO family nonheme iron enzyme [Alphaproteobacteria bacterium]
MTEWHPLADGNPPEWASEWGQDRFGVFVAFTIRDVTQRLRWIRPGRFLMGSPENEPERFNDEGPQHAVHIARGFWLADTACTQALWRAVMGNNPSHFQGENLRDSSKRPVERVSWNDVQVFLERVNGMVPGLNLSLPTEAQWEYACRAGTTGTFSFGDTITPEQVNYNGNLPYAGGEKGLFREQTVPVKSLPPNPWGLYEMHGNVWEWVQDHWHDSYEGAPAHGSAWLDKQAEAVADGVFRGGSWFGDARSVRSAARDWTRPGHRDADLGFRCARVQA